MGCWSLRKHKPQSLKWLLMLVMIPILMVRPAQGGCIEEERKALLEIKFSLIDSYGSKGDHILPTWINFGNDLSGDGVGAGECCDWERVKCNTTTGHVTELSLYNLKEISEILFYDVKDNWPLNVSLFLHFEELTTLDLSYNFLDGDVLNTELERLSSLKKLESLDLSKNLNIDNGIIPSLSALTSLISLNISWTSMKGYFPVNEFSALENLETLDVSSCGFNGTFQSEGYERIPILRKLKVLNLGDNKFNENIIPSLRVYSSLKVLDLGGNKLNGTFPARDLANITNLEELDLSRNDLNFISSIEDCKSLSRLKRLESISFRENYSMNKSIISCLSSLPSLKALDLSGFLSFLTTFQINELSILRELETLDLSNGYLESPTLNDLTDLPHLKVLILSGNLFNGTIPVEAFASFHHLEVLDLSGNNFVGSIPSAIRVLSSLRVLSLANNNLSGSLLDRGLCELKDLRELDLSHNMFEGSLPECFSSLSSLKLLDISSNQLSGMLPPSLISNLTSLEYIDISHNKFEGSFSFSSFSNLARLEVVRFINMSRKFELETEEPKGWVPMFQLKFLVLSNCNINRAKRSIFPAFLHHQTKLQMIDLSHNSIEGLFPNWLIENNTKLEAINLRNNSFDGSISMPPNKNANLVSLDISENLMNGSIPSDIHKTFPYIRYLNLSRNAIGGGIPSSLGELSLLAFLDISDNDLSGEVPKGLFTYFSPWKAIKLSNNKLHGQVLSGNLSLGNMGMLFLDSNCFTGKIGSLNMSIDDYNSLEFLDISNNFFTGIVPGWIANLTYLSRLVMRNNSLEGRFPCGTAPSFFLDISQNSFSGPISSCLNWVTLHHLYLGSNRFTGSIPSFFRTLTGVLTLDIGNNDLSGPIPKFIGELSSLRILILRENNFSGSIPIQLCQLSDVSLIDLSSNSLYGSIPGCLHNLTGATSYLAFTPERNPTYFELPPYGYESVLHKMSDFNSKNYVFESQDEVYFTTKALSLSYKGSILDYMSGLDLSCNKLTGEIPEELGLLTHIRALNLSHNQLTGPIPVQLSDLANIESLDLSSNGLTGKVPSELIKLNSLAVFNVSYNNLSGRLPEMKAQFGTFTNESYEGNPRLCGRPLEKKCPTISPVTKPLSEEADTEKWYDINMTSFYASFGSTLVVFMLGFATVLYMNPCWFRRWLNCV